MKGGIFMYLFLLILAFLILSHAKDAVAATFGFASGASGFVGTLQGRSTSFKSNTVSVK